MKKMTNDRRRGLFAVTALLAMLVACRVMAQDFVTNGSFTRLDPKGLPEDWQLASFHDSPRPEVSVVTADGRRACQLTFRQTHRVYCLSLWQAAPPLEVDGDYVVRFACQATGTGSGDMSAALSGGIGCCLPCVRGWHVPQRDGKWHEVDIRLPARGLKRESTVLELCFNNDFEAGDVIRLANLRVDFEPGPPLTIMCTDPPSGVVFTDARSQDVAGVLRVTRAFSQRTARVALLDARAPDRPLEVRQFTTEYPRTGWRFRLGSYPTGKYYLAAEVRNADGTIAAQDRVAAWRVKPTPTTTRVVEGKVYCGGKPVVLLGTYHVADWIVDVTNTENKRIGAPLITRTMMLEEVARQGFGTFFYTNGIPSESFLSDSWKRGLKAIPAMAGVGREWGGAPIVEQVPRVTDDARILGWGGYDEPGLQNMPGAVRVYRELKSVSPRKLVVSSFNNPEPLLALEGETPPADLILMDIYTIFKPGVDMSWVGQAVRQAVTYAREHPGLAVGVAPQAFIYGGGPEPTPEQLRAQVYLGLVNGARAFFPYSYAEDWGAPFSTVPGQPSGMSLNPRRQRWFLPDSNMWLSFPKVFAEIKTLEEVILNGGRPLNVTAEQSAIQYLAKQVGKIAYLIAVNPKATPEKISFHFAIPPAKLTPLFDTPSARVNGKELSLEFSGYEVKVFRITPLNTGKWPNLVVAPPTGLCYHPHTNMNDFTLLKNRWKRQAERARSEALRR